MGTREEAVRRVVAQLDAQLEEPLADCLATDAHGRPCLQAASPLDVEASLAMPGGHIFHGDLSWPVADDQHPAGTWGAATAHPRVVSASSGGTVRGGAVSGLGRLRRGPPPAGLTSVITDLGARRTASGCPGVRDHLRSGGVTARHLGWRRPARAAQPGDQYELVTLEVGDPGPGEVLVEMAYAGLCHSDEHLRHSNAGGRTRSSAATRAPAGCWRSAPG